MSPTEFEEAMSRIAATVDIEERHIEADDLMCEVLTELGFGRGVEIFERMPKWYA